MRILLVTAHRRFSGGVESVNRTLQQIFEADGHRVDYLTAEAAGQGKRAALGQRLAGLPARTASAYKSVRANDYDLVLANGEFGLGIEHPNAVCLFHGSYRGLRDHLRPYLSARQYLSLSWQAAIQRIAANGKHVVAVSRFIADILTGQGIRVMQVIENCVDTDAFSPSTPPPSDAPYLFVGSYHRYAKGFDVLERLQRVGLPINCVTNQSPGAQLGFICPVSHEEMPEIYRRHRLLVFPSRFEAFGLAPLEALSCGLPVVMLDVGLGRALRTALPDFVVDARSNDLATAFAERIDRIESRYAEHSRAAREYVLQRHSYAQFSNAWRSFIRERVAC